MFIAAVRPFIREKCEIQLRIKREGAALSITVIPRIDGLDAGTNDETIAALQAALAKPFHLHVADTEDPDKALAGVLTAIGQAQAGAHDDLTAYTARIEADRKAAKEATEKKAAENKAKIDAAKSKKATPAKSAVTKAAPVEPTKRAAPAPVSAVDLFAAAPAADATVNAPAAEAASAPATETTAGVQGHE